MKQSALLILLLTALTANATDNSRDEHNPNTNAIAGANASSNAAANALAGAFSASTGGYSTTGGVSVSTDTEKPAVASAIAPSITQNAICPIITPNSHAVQFLFFGGSTSGGQSLNAECVAYHLQQYEVLEQMTCAKSADYRKANANCK